MALVTAILSALAAFPKILEVIEQVARSISQQAQIIRNKKLVQDLEDAAAKAKQSKDTTDLDHVFDLDKKK